MKLNLVSLGCARNLVDSEVMLTHLVGAGWTITPDPAEADVIVVNTCSFIESAVNESIDTILELARFKNTGKCRRLVVAGCLPERFRQNIVSSLPEVDIFLGTGAFDKIAAAVEGSLGASTCLLPDPDLIPMQAASPHRVPSNAHVAYLKIAEGCSRQCTYCIIPRLRGKHKSRPLESIVAEAHALISTGIRELVLVAQETTAYGRDLPGPSDLGHLLAELAGLSDEVWIRFLYGHPETLTPSIIKVVSRHPALCSYFDIPIQHVSRRILKKMGRHYSREDLYRLFEQIRTALPEAALRTTAIVGFPGESEQDFQELMTFVKTVRFDHLGVFTYSDSEDLASHRLSDHVSARAAKSRYNRLMTCQADISRQNNQKYVGRELTVLVEEGPDDTVYSGRSMFQAPEVDGLTYVKSGEVAPGQFTRVKITDALEYDLIGEMVGS